MPEPSEPREVEALLANHRRAGSFLESPAEPEPKTDGGSLLGLSLGAYRVVRRIGYGGMGAVYLAERSDAQYRQQVAVKVLKLGMDSELLVARFRQERQILASLDHPGIARLLDGGNLEDGRPWPLKGQTFAGIVVANYLYRPLFPHILASLEDGGVLICETFAQGNEQIGRPRNPDHLLAPGELLDVVAGKLLVVAYEHGLVETPRRAMVQRICALHADPGTVVPISPAPE